MTDLKRHPLSAAWGDMTPEEFQELVDDIEVNGQRDRIALFGGQVLDGWHRYLACKRLALACASADLREDEDPVAFVISKNAKRRSLTAGQKATAVAKCQTWAPEGKPRNSAPGAELSADAKPMTAAQMAKAAGVSPRTVEQAKEVITKGTPEVQAAVKAGKVSVKTAAKVAKKPKEQQAEALKEATQPKRRKKRAAKATAPTIRLEVHNDAHDDFDLIAEMEKMRLELESAHALIKVAEATDLKAEAMKWRRAYEAAQRTASEKMDTAARLQAELQKTSDRLVRIGKLFGERDPSKIPSCVEAFYRAHSKVAA